MAWGSERMETINTPLEVVRHPRPTFATEESEGDRERGPKSSPGGHSDQIGIGQRVAEQALIDRSRLRQRGSDKAGEQHARQADVVDDRPPNYGVARFKRQPPQSLPRHADEG